MLDKKMENALNKQIKNEFYSAYLYMSMSASCTSLGLKGFANWFMVQYHEEMFHAMKIYEYINNRGGSIKLAAIKQPPISFKSPLDMFTQTLKHEQSVTRSVNDLVELAIKLKDHASQIFLQWYVSEQVEEENNDNDILARLKLIGKDNNGLFMLDRELSGRTNTMPTDYSKGVEGAAGKGGA